jgi:RimJ/RimL family protein N-acetyltransferase
VAIHLYERFGFQPTGYLEKRYRRASGELWDSLEMTLALQGSDPTPARSR